LSATVYYWRYITGRYSTSVPYLVTLTQKPGPYIMTLTLSYWTATFKPMTGRMGHVIAKTSVKKPAYWTLEIGHRYGTPKLLSFSGSNAETRSLITDLYTPVASSFRNLFKTELTSTLGHVTRVLRVCKLVNRKNREFECLCECLCAIFLQKPADHGL